MSIKTYTVDTDRWQVVPREMTHKMRDVIRMGNGGWRELLAAAPEPPAQPEAPTRDLLAEARDQVEALDRENHKMRRCVARLMARLTVWLDDDQFNEAAGIVHPEFEPPAQQPMKYRKKPDRIAELRALITAERVADGAHRQAPGPGKWAAWQCAEIDLRDAAAESLPALLDCAEALTEILRCPHGVDEATIPAGGIDVHPKQVVVSMSVGLVRLRRAQAALAKLNGDNHD